MPLGISLQDECLIADPHRVTGVVSALITDHHVESVGKQIDDFPLTLVSPLGAQDDYITHK